MPTATNGTDEVDYVEINSYGLDFSTESNTQSVMMEMEIAQSNEPKFNKAVLGYSLIQADKIIRRPPYAHPRYPWLRATAVRFKGVTQEAAQNTGPLGCLQAGRTSYDVTYTDVRYPVRDSLEPPVRDPYIIPSEVFTIDSVIVPNAGMQFYVWADGSTIPINEPPSRPEPAADLAYLWRQIPMVEDENGVPRLHSTLRSRIIAAQGTINNDTFDGIYGKHNLLCLSPEVTPPYRMSDGKWACDITYRFALRGFVDVSGVALGTGTATPNWRRIIRQGNTPATQYEGITRSDGAAGAVYEESDFDNLFKLD